MELRACNEMNRPLPGIGGSVEDIKPEREEMDDDNKDDDSETSLDRVDSRRGIGGETEALLANEQPTNLGDNRALDGERLEATDENDLATLASKALVEEETAAKAKGKEKALSDGSVESCNSAGLLSRGKKRPGFEQQLILGSKRLKTSQECFGSTSKLKQDSSFMNWISNMTKGIWKGNEEELSPCCRNTGFQTFFQSIYCPKKRGEDASNDANAASLLKLPEKCLNTKGDHLSSSGNEVGPVAEPSISSGKVGFHQTSAIFSSEDKEPNISLLFKPSEEQKTCGEADEKDFQCLTNKNSGLESLWITRFSSQSSFPQKKDLPGRITNEVANDSQKAILPIVSSLRLESSEAMASLFARRLESLKHICFYCGKKGHRLQDCLEVTDTELRDLVENINARNGREEASSLCIKCFQLSHWAATCPNAPPYSSGAEDRVALASTSGTKLPFSGFTAVPKAVFDAVQVLRLTRTDVLKWINSKKSVSGLEGFFLRLRLGKWEEGLGGTGYHVARIQGTTESEGQSSKKHPVNSSVSVKVGGMTCFIESQFISNHDFLEEELKAWWRSARKSAGRSGGDGIPSAEELGRKIQQRKMLEF